MFRGPWTGQGFRVWFLNFRQNDLKIVRMNKQVSAPNAAIFTQQEVEAEFGVKKIPPLFELAGFNFGCGGRI